MDIVRPPDSLLISKPLSEFQTINVCNLDAYEIYNNKYNSKLYSLQMAEPGVSSCMEGFGTKETLEEEMEILSAIMTDRRCTKVATFVKDNVESFASSGAFDSFQLFLSLMQTTYNDKWFQDLCAIRTEA